MAKRESTKKVLELTCFKGRTLQDGDVVQVHYNLHEGGFTIKNKKSGLVVAYAPYVNLLDVVTRVRPSGREKVLLEKKKNVHAIIEGTFTLASIDLTNAKPLVYNPYLYESFVDGDTKEKVLCANRVQCVGKAALYIPTL